MRSVIVIPARYGSTRMPGKPLKNISGKTLLQRVVHIAQTAGAATGTPFVVATDHADIAAHCEALNAPFVMTDPNLPSGTDRALAAVRAARMEADFVLNLQGDAPFTEPAHVAAMLAAAAAHDEDVMTPVIQLDWAALDILRSRKQQTPFSGTTCVRAADGRALWFSKQVLPAIRKEEKLKKNQPLSPVFRHIGLYGYRMAALQKFCELPVGVYEELEGLEQLRFLENNMTIRAVVVEKPRISRSGVDSPEDAALAESLIAQHGDPMSR